MDGDEAAQAVSEQHRRPELGESTVLGKLDEEGFDVIGVLGKAGDEAAPSFREAVAS